MRVGILLNPNSRKNRRELAQSGSGNGARLRRLRRRLGNLGEVIETQDLEELEPAIRRLLDQGVEYLVSDGGDGALHWILNLVREMRGDEGLVPLVPTCGGTIDFVSRKVGSIGAQDAIVERLLTQLEQGVQPDVVWLDSLRLTGAYVSGASQPNPQKPFDRLGFALAAGGVGQRFFDQYYASDDPRAATIVAIVLRTLVAHAAARIAIPGTAALQEYAAALFKPTQARVTIDGTALESTAHGAIHAGAFDVSLGGVFKVFPLAHEPGQLHFQAGAITPLEMIQALPDLVRGGSIKSRYLREVAGTEMRIDALGEEALAPIIDGEQFRELSQLVITPGPQVPIVRV